MYKSIPAFTAGLTLDAFERNTLSAGPPVAGTGLIGAPEGGGGGGGGRR